MNQRKLTVGYYRPTESFKSIPEHIAVMFEDDQTLVAIVGASDDNPDNLAETNRYAELFASAPEQADIIRELTDQLMDAAIERHIVMRDGSGFNTGHRGDYITCPEYRCTKSREALIKGRV